MTTSEAGFKHDPLRDMVAVGKVDPHSARLWLKSHGTGRHRVKWWSETDAGGGGETVVEIPEENPRDNTASLLVPPKEDVGAALSPLTPYRFRIIREADGNIVGEGRFETAPESVDQTPRRFSVALMSCHQPLDKNGEITPAAGRMLRAVRRVFAEHEVKFILMVGDQMYSDYPAAVSLLDPAYFATVAPEGRRRLQDCTSEEVRRLYHRQYRYFWNMADWQALHAEYPSYPILDDHDIIDNWGSVPEHQQPEWRSVGRGSRQAYQDYQASRIEAAGEDLPHSFQYSFAYGNTATLVMDLRSNRTAGAGGRLYSGVQEEGLRHFLKMYEAYPILFIVLSVPVVHLPRFLARAVARLPESPEDFADRWSSGAHLRDRDRFFKIIRDHQRRNKEQQMIFMSGDIHIACAHRIQWEPMGASFYQLISSGITHTTGYFIQKASKLLIKANRRISTVDQQLSGRVHLMADERGRGENPYGGLNLGIVEIETPAPGERPAFRFLIYGHQDEAPRRAFQSEWVR